MHSSASLGMTVHCQFGVVGLFSVPKLAFFPPTNPARRSHYQFLHFIIACQQATYCKQLKIAPWLHKSWYIVCTSGINYANIND
jgi:hypothetical protein